MNRPTALSRDNLTRKERKDLRILALFTSVYCSAHHQGAECGGGEGEDPLKDLRLGRYPVCRGCWDFLCYAVTRRLRCPLDPKPVCKHCTVNCYRPGHREKVREIMRFSGRHLLRRGRLDLLWHYLF